MKAPKVLRKTYIYDKFGPDPAGMLVVTGLIGWGLSSAAQIFAIAINDKISKKDKLFLIPQEFADGFVNALAFLTLSAGIKNIGKKLSTTAKIRSKDLTVILERDGHILKNPADRVDGKAYAGDWNFNVTKLPNYETELKDVYKPLNNGVEVIAGLVGSILSCNLVTPIFRNRYAANRQKEILAKKTNLPVESNIPTSKVSFKNFQQLAYSRPQPYSSGLKI